MVSHSRAAAPRPALARLWTCVALVTATLGIGALLPDVTGGTVGSGSQLGLALAPAITPIAPRQAEPRADTMTRSVPTRIQLPALGVSAPVVPVGLAPNGAMQVPSGTTRAGWYEQSPTPGEQGPAVLVAHVDWAGKLGVFHDIGRLHPGNTVRIGRADGTLAIFRIDRVASYPKQSLPIGDIFGAIDSPGLRLITCGGAFDRATGQYVDNVVAYATLVPSS